jgi:xylulokinase
MDSKQYLLAYDVGTTGMKTCLFSAGGHLELVASALAKYPLYLFEGGGAEQDPEDWWKAMVTTTVDVLGSI